MTPNDFSYESNADGYMLFYRGKPIGGASVMLDPNRRRHWRHTRANVKMFADNARDEIRALESGQGQKRFRDAMAEIDASEAA